MNQFLRGLTSSVGKKFIMALTGLALVGFIITHLLGNLLLLLPEGDAFNTYAHGLMSLGFLLYIAEAGLLALFLIHIFTAISLTKENRAARPVAYAATRSKFSKSKGGTPHRSHWASNRMIVSGMVLGVFLVWHLWHLKFGPGENEGYQTVVDGVIMRDLFQLVVETFKNPVYVGLYLAAMVLLGLHLRHGFWSLFQSLGIAYPKWTNEIYCLGLLLAVAIGGGFFLIPVWIYFDLAYVVPDAIWGIFL